MPLLLSDTSRIEEHIELARWSSGNELVIGVGLTVVLLLAVRWLYRHEQRGSMSPRARLALMLLRCGVLLLMGLIALEPVRVRYLHRTIDAVTLVLVDESASMGLADRYRGEAGARRVAAVAPAGADPAEGITRAALVRRIASPEWLGALSKQNRVRVFGFSDRVRPLAEWPARTAAPPEIELGVEPIGAATHLGLAVREAVEAAGGAPVAAVVLLSDGCVNAGEPIEAVGQFLRSRQIPLHAIGVGDPSEPVNVRLVEVTAPRMVFKDDPFNITAFLGGEGLSGRSVDVELVERTAGGQGRTVAQRSARARPDGSFEPVAFERRVARPGDWEYEVRVAPLEDESIASDNARTVFPAVRVLDDKMRVLLVGGAPSYDYRFLARLLIRDRSVNVSCWLQSADRRAVREGTTVIDHLPATREELLKYDAVLLVDPNPAELPADWGRLLASLVSEYGGGVLYVAGRKYTTEFFRSPRTAPIAEILPVARDPDSELMLNDLGIYQRKSWPVIVPDAALTHPIMRMADDPAGTRAQWALFEGVFWHYPVRREKPAASVLLRHSNPRMVNSAGPHILMATQYVGSGRSAWLGTDDTWRWRRVSEASFNRFWIQSLRYIVEGKLAGSRNRALLLADRDRCQPGESITITARLLDETYKPLAGAVADVTVGLPSGATRTLTLDALEGRPGYYQGRLVAEQPGPIRLSVSLPSAAGEAATATCDVSVAPSDLEMRSLTLRREPLIELARQTGGTYHEMDEAGRVPEAIEDRSQTLVVAERPRPIWDNAWVLAALVGLLSVEWAARRALNLL